MDYPMSNKMIYSQINQILNSNTPNLEKIESLEDQLIANSMMMTKIIDGEFFKKESILNKGAHGNVYKCRRPRSGKIVAIKEIPIGKGYLTLTEGQIMKDLSSDHENWPYFVRLYNEFESYTARYLVMEYCAGVTLEKFVKQKGGGLSIKSYMAHLVQGVKKLHSHGYIHRDLKPSNILIVELSNGDIQLKISDFGLTTTYNAFYQSPTNLQPSPYRAPELIEGLEYDKSVEVYSLGAIYFFIFDGKDPNFQFDKCGYPIIPNETRNERHATVWNQMMCRRADERLTLEDIEFDFGDGGIYIPERNCAVCGRELYEF